MSIAMFIAILAVLASHVLAQGESSSCNATTQYLRDPPYDNYFFSDCNVDAQAVVTSPLPESNLSIVGPRLIIAWPAGNSGICTFFQPQNGKNGSLAIQLVNSTFGAPLGPVVRSRDGSKLPDVGVGGVMSFNTSSEITLSILGSIRTIRDFTEGPSLLRPVIQDAVKIEALNGTGVSISRLWLDNKTVSIFTLVPYENDDVRITISNRSARFGAGFYRFQATLNYPQLTQLTPQQVLNNESQSLNTAKAAEATSLSFLSYAEKLLAGAWRFLTYFDRDSMISALLLEPALSIGNGSAMEAVIGAVLERINRTDGSICHEETIGDYATYLNLQNNQTSTAPGFTYPMIDTDYYLPILMASYFRKQPERIEPLLATQAGSVDVENNNLTYGELVLINAEKIMNITAAFEQNQTIANLIHLKDGEVVGQWRDSTYGLANGRIPFDVSCALVPAALRAISSLSSTPGIFPNTTLTQNWSAIASTRAKLWEDNTLPLFQYNLTRSKASTNIETFLNTSTFYSGPSNTAFLNYSSPDGSLIDYALAINSTQNQTRIPILHTDTAFRLFLVNSTDQTQLTTFINSTANTILRPFPAGLTTPVGLVVANPALSGSSVLNTNFTNSAYHGTVIWSWQLSLMAKGLERQLARCNDTTRDQTESIPAFCNETSVYSNVRAAYNSLWNTIEANTQYLQSEVWSWTYSNATGYTQVQLGSLPPPPGVSAGTESNVRQLWSLTFLAVKRNEVYR